MNYKVKKEYLKYYCSLVGEIPNLKMMTACFPSGHEHYKILKDAGVLDLWCEKDEWKDPLYDESLVILTDKPLLLIRMQSWADFYNELDGFVPDWVNRDSQIRHGIVLDGNQFTADWHPYNYFLFQICVGSKERAKEMLEYFKHEINSLINQGLI